MNLSEFFAKHTKVALAFSGGVDSAYLLYATTLHKVDVVAYYIRSQFQPEFEYNDAIRLAKELNARIKVIDVDVLQNDKVAKNPSNRCYICKNMIFQTIINVAKEDGYTTIIDGTNASDLEDDRPGMKALKELSVLSPLRLCGITKDEVRKLSKEAGLFTWDKPAYACLATRVKTDEIITADALRRIEIAEDYLHELGLLNVRVRYSQNKVRLEIDKKKIDLFEQYKTEIFEKLSNMFEDIESDITYR